MRNIGKDNLNRRGAECAEFSLLSLRLCGKKNMTNTTTIPFSFVLVFLLFSLIFFLNSYKLWFRTDQYYEELYQSLSRPNSPYPFRDFFLKGLQNKKQWVLRQKLFSALGLAAVLVADVFVIMMWLNG
jgi:hypothetical protein